MPETSSSVNAIVPKSLIIACDMEDSNILNGCND